ncbi:histidine decarboxylase-like [Henckelia pumila]|uniref:histidine decarboxylase-like n=1 Tax=Henckelia pumila TaxID=405737 RepID=UPI003C6E4843
MGGLEISLLEQAISLYLAFNMIVTVSCSLSISWLHVQDIGGAQRFSLTIHDFCLNDKSDHAPWKLVLGYYRSKKVPRMFSSKAVKLNLDVVKPDPSIPLEENRFKFGLRKQDQAILNIRLTRLKGNNIKRSQRAISVRSLSRRESLSAPVAGKLKEPKIGYMEDHDHEDLESIGVIEAYDENRVTNTLSKYHDYLAGRASYHLGFPANQNCHHYMDLSPFLEFSLNNIGDPFKDSHYGLHSKKFERGVLDWFARLWGLGKDEYWGYITNGGTEGNLQGLLLGRELLPNGILYSSSDSHYSIFKVARMYRMDWERIEALNSGEMDCADLKDRLLCNKDKPAIINVNIGTTFKGGVDNLELVIKTLEQCGFSQNQYYIHCDAALFGLVIPFLKQGPNYNFQMPIGSLSISGHKFLGSPMPCGVLLARKKYINLLSQSVEYIASVDTTISGSRNGHAPVFMWYSLSIKGHIGVEQDAQRCVMYARHLRDRLKSEGISSMLNETSFVVVLERPLDQEFVCSWKLQCHGDLAHVVVMPHVTKQMLDLFLDDLLRRRKFWYGCGEAEPPCLAKEIGVPNCECPVHGKEKKLH